MKYKIDRKWKWLWGCMLGAAWISLLILFLKNRGGLSVEDILRCQPESKGKVILVMLGLFTLKSVDFLLHSGVLYAADGVMFSLPAAIAINLLGAAVMVTPPFFIGRTIGQPMLNELTEKHPKIRQIAEIPEKSELVVNILLRTWFAPRPLADACRLYSHGCRDRRSIFACLLDRIRQPGLRQRSFDRSLRFPAK